MDFRSGLGDLDARIDNPGAHTGETAKPLTHDESCGHDAIAGDIDARGLGVKPEDSPFGPVRCVHDFTFPRATDISLVGGLGEGHSSGIYARI